MHLQSPNPASVTGGQRLDLGAVLDGAASHGPGHHGPKALLDECSVDGEPNGLSAPLRGAGGSASRATRTIDTAGSGRQRSAG